ncbi:MAG: hypothetical protein FD177_1803 [Desulfovibrionaceae bacterium]|nr:MAG: hypothetical protein FD177_1803 [Desulfovibrionaceae bacterium]
MFYASPTEKSHMLWSSGIMAIMMNTTDLGMHSSNHTMQNQNQAGTTVGHPISGVGVFRSITQQQNWR